MRIGVKVGLLVGTLVLAQAASLGVASTITMRAQGEYDQVLNQVIDESMLAGQLSDQYQQQTAAWAQLLVHYHHQSEANQAAATIKSSSVQVGRTINKLKEGSHDKALLAELADLQAEHQKLTGAMLAAVPTVESGLYNVDDPTIATLEKQVDELAAAPRARAAQRGQDAMFALQESQRKALNWLIWISGLLLAIPAGAAVIVARRIVAPITELTDAATENAERALPQAVDQIGLMSSPVVAPEVETFDVDTNDELSKLGSALNAMQASSLALAVRQRETELNSAETLVNLGRRNQSLLSRTLSYLGELERDEKDSIVLGKLYRLDHGITRVRRNMESMLVLAGVEQTRATSRPVAATDVVRAALSEIEEFRQVKVRDLAPVILEGAISADLAHLLAELLENGTHFSQQPVLVSGSEGAKSYTISVIDHGSGMTAEQLAEANRKLALTGRALHDTHVLGHTIAGRIAERHGFTVRLEATPEGGVTASILIPNRYVRPVQSVGNTTGVEATVGG